MLLSQRTVSAEAHQSTIETVRQTTNLEGQTVLVTNRYVELATGLNRWEERQKAWAPAVAEFEPTEDGYLVARQTQTQLILPPNLSTEPVDMLGPDGVRLISAPIGVAVVDLSTGDTALLGNLKSCRAEQVTPHTVVYRDCFTGLKADLVYEINLAGMEQFVVLREWLPALEDLKMDPAHVRVQVYTEFFDAPEPTGKEVILKRADDATLAQRIWEPDLADRELRFGESTRMIPGRAFAAGAQNVDAPVAKSYEAVGERRLLVESCDYRDVAPWLEQLPVPREAVEYEGVRLEPGQLVPSNLPEREANKPRWASLPFDNRLKEKAWASVSRETLKAMDTGAYLAASGPGLVLDYTTISGTKLNLTFSANTTYYVSGTVILTGTTTLEGGTVIKYAPVSLAVLVRDEFECKTALYRPAIFTARDDDTIGSVVAGSDGVVEGSYASFPLYFQTDNPVDVRHIRVKHTLNGLCFNAAWGEGFTHLVRHAQFIDCTRTMTAFGDVTLKAQNILVADLKAGGAAFYGNSLATIKGQHLTVANTPNLYQNFDSTKVTLWNSLLVDVDEIQDYNYRSVFPVCNVEMVTPPSPDPPVFQTVGGGHYYLAEERYRVMTSNSDTLYGTGWPLSADWPWPPPPGGTDGEGPDADLWAELERMTVVPPEPRSGSLATDEVWASRKLGDCYWWFEPPLVGYHYPILDYLVGDLTLEDATLTLTKGLAVGVGCSENTPNGFVLEAGGSLVSEGKPVDLNRMVHQALVQEESFGNATLISQQGSTGAGRTVNLRATELAIPAYSGRHFDGGAATAQLTLRDCELYGGLFYFQADGAISRTVTLNNNVFVRVKDLILGTGTDAGLTADAYNNTFYRCPTIVLNATTGTSWQWHDNLFDNSGFWLFYADVVNSHNAYVFTGIGDPLPNSSGNDILLNGCSGLTYVSDEWGRGWYPLPDNGLFTDKGSRSAEDAGLYFHTIESTHPHPPEGTTQVDIGFHQSALVRPVPVDPIVPSNAVHNPVCVDYHPIQDALIVSVNFEFGLPNNFVSVKKAGSQWNAVPWSAASGHGWQIEHMVVQDTSWSLPQGSVLFGGQDVSELYPTIRYISPSGIYDPNPWAVINDDPGDSNRWPMAFAVDFTGGFGNDLVVTTSYGNLLGNPSEVKALGGRIVRIDPVSKDIEVVSNIGHYMQGLIILPNDTAQYGGDWAGHILTRGQDGPWLADHTVSGLLRVGSDGSTDTFFLGALTPFDFTTVSAGESLYVAQILVQGGRGPAPPPIASIPSGFFTNLTPGDVVAMQSGEMFVPQVGPFDGSRREPPELFCLHWQTENGATEVILSQLTYRPLGTEDFFESVRFAPISLPPGQ